METHYEILQVSENASIDQIKLRFQQLILLHHPDKSDGIPDDRAHRILQAWHVLRDDKKRRQYDAELKAKQSHQVAVINAEVDLDDMDYDEATATFSLGCRCSGTYSITEDDLEDSVDVVCCDNCSLRIRVLYALAGDE
ncbi:DNAJ heat shock N-terminal domain-containing protein [Syncephalastrum racemosum]|uniref:Diphthamide biosynthesis protein 4 n=1 Tax=Syncephalastrum racemosum TaxID=13706 RepID=A0A1X2HHS3_SYNRA|nr:DNAJ heat shock N-terminal domain-containing protein [Syncephalastrum racemosum]